MASELRLHCHKVLSNGWCWLPLYFRPFSFWESHFPGCRVFRVLVRERSGEQRTAYVLIGPRRFISAWQSCESRSEQW